MKTKNKLIIAFSALGVVAVAAVIALVAVLAAGQQTVTSSINVTYTATDVTGSATLTYKKGSDDWTTFSNNSVNFAASDDARTQNITLSDGIELSATTSGSNKVVEDLCFRFVFTNTGSTSYYATITGLTAPANGSLYVSTNDNYTTYKDAAATKTIEVPTTGATFYVLFTGANVAQDISFNFAPTWTLNKTLQTGQTVYTTSTT